MVKDLDNPKFWMGSLTATARSLQQAFGRGKYDGVLLLTDEQYNVGYRSDPTSVVPESTPVYTFNLAGYRGGHEAKANRITVGGLNDGAFTMIATIENAKAAWPWEA
jgi:hypothetical protein